MKKLIFFLLLTGSINLASAQDTFIKTYDSIIGTCLMPASGAFVIGGSSSVDFINYWPYPGLLKIGVYGDSLWQVNYPFQAGSSTSVFAKTHDNGFVIAFREVGVSNTRVIRTDADGDTVWTRLFNNIAVTSIITGNDSNYVMTGMFAATALVVKIDQNGNLLWRDEFRPDVYSYAIDLCNTSDNGYAVVGYKSHMNAPAIGYLMKLSSDGDSLWSTFYDDHAWQLFYDVHQLPDNGFVISGMADTVGFMTTSTAYLLRTDQSGTLLWNNLYTSVGEKMFRTVEIIGTGGYIVCGWAGADANSMIVLEKIAPTGIAEWIRTFSIGERAYGYHALPLSDGFILVGESDSLSDSTTVVIRTDAMGFVTGINDDIAAGTIKPAVFPNPCTDNFTLSLDKPVSDAILEIYDMEGSKVFTCRLIDKMSQHIVDISGFPAGVYSCRITGKYGSGSCIFIKVRY